MDIFFTDFLQRSASMVGSSSVSEEDVKKYRAELEKRRSEAPKSQCARCFVEVSGPFDKHIRITRSMKSYRSDEEARRAIESLFEDAVIKNALEPISNRQRLRILKMLASQARSFFAISDQSGLREGTCCSTSSARATRA